MAALPEDINALSALQELYLDENDFEVFPDSVGELFELRKLSFCKNYFNTFPLQISNCSRLESLRFSGTPSPLTASLTACGFICT